MTISMEVDEETHNVVTTPPVEAESGATTPVPEKDVDRSPTPTDSLVTVSLSETDTARTSSITSMESMSDYAEPEDQVSTPKPEPAKPVPVDSFHEDLESIPETLNLVDDPLEMEDYSTFPRSSSEFVSDLYNRERSDSSGSESSVQVDWEALDKTEERQEEDTDEQTTLLLARLEQENNAIAIDPKSGIKSRSSTQSRPPSIYKLKRLVQEQGARSVRFSLVPAAAPMTELEFWAALVRDYPQTAQRLPTITSNKIRSGIPVPLRGVVWVSMAGARDKSIEEQYDKLCRETSPYEKMIGKDIGRSFPGHEMFKDPEGQGQQMLGRVLKCYSLYDDKIGYCQGLGFLVGPLLMNMGEKEAFCVLVRLMEDYDLRSCFLPDLSGLQLRIYQFSKLLHQHLPKLAAHLDELGVEGAYLSQWFLSFFAVTCPLPLLFRVYDVIFAEGASETLMRVALSIMQRNEKKLLGFVEFEDAMQLLLSRQLWDQYGMNPASADEFVADFVAFTSLVTRESLNTLEHNFRNSESGGRLSFLPDVQNTASRFLGRLWTSGSKTNGLSPTPTGSRHSDTLLRTPSKQSLSTLGSVEGGSDVSPSTAATESSMSWEPPTDGSSIKIVKSATDPLPSGSRSMTSPKDKDLHGQIEDLLTALSEMQREHAIIAQQLQKEREERSESDEALRSVMDHIKSDLVPATGSHRRTASDSTPAYAKALSIPTLRLLETVNSHLMSSQYPRSSGTFETKAQLYSTIVNLKEQVHIESTRAQDVARQLESKEQEAMAARDELQKARQRIKDSHFDKQRLEKKILDLKQVQRIQGGPGPALSHSSSGFGFDDDQTRCESPSRDSTGQQKLVGLRELRLGRGFSRSGPVTPPVFGKRSSSLIHHSPSTSVSSEVSFTPHAVGGLTSNPLSVMTASLAKPENDALLLELAKAKTAEAVARQELEEMRVDFEAIRKTISMTPSPQSGASQQHQMGGAVGGVANAARTLSDQERVYEHSKSASVGGAAPNSAASNHSAGWGMSAGGFFGWGKKQGGWNIVGG